MCRKLFFYFIKGLFTKVPEFEHSGFSFCAEFAEDFNIGIVNFAANNKSEAVTWWKKAIEIDPNTNIAKKAEELINSHQQEVMFMPCGKKRKRHKMSTHKRKKRLRKNRHKKKLK